MTHTTLNWERTLADAGMRVTRQRATVLDAVCAAGGHTPIGDILLRARKLDPTIDLSTIYRALKVFQDLGIVLTATASDGEVFYEIRHQEPHHHLICRMCGNEISVSGEIVAAMAEQIATVHGFVIEPDHLVLWGTCARCRSQE
jgi:Fe2+ or Zn2+ uptake regulation protein